MSNDPALGPQGSPLFGALVSDESGSLTKRDLLTLLFKRKFEIIFLWVGVTVLVAAALFYLPPTYVADAKVLVKIEQQGRPSFLSGIAAYNEAPDTEPANRKLETEMEVMLSRSLAEKVVGELKLEPKVMYRPPYVHLLAPVGKVIDWVKVDLLGFAPKPPRDFETAVEAFVKSLTIAPATSKGGEATPNLITIRFKASTAAAAHDGLSRLMFHYQHFSNELDQKNGERAYRIVEQRMSDALGEVVKAQAELERFAMTVQPGLAVDTFALQRSGDASALSAANGTNGSAPGNVWRNRVAQLEVELADLRQKYTDKVESVASVKAALADARAHLAEQTADSAQGADRQLTLQRQMRLAEDHYLDLKRKLTQIGLFLEMNPNQVSNRVLVEPPLRPDSSEWKKSVAIGIAACLAGLFLGLGVASLLEYADHRFTTPSDVERYTGLPLLVSIDLMDEDGLRAFTGMKRGEPR